MLKQQFDYIAHGPKQGPARKLVILLHGYGVNARYMEKLAQEVIRSVSDALVLCVNAPERMDLPKGGHQDLTVFPPQEATAPPEGLGPDDQLEWFAITLSAAEMKDALLAVAKKLNAFIDDQRDTLGIRDSDIAIMGFSQGGAVALYTACTRDRKIAAAVGHSTIVIDTDKFTTRPPVLLVHGTADKNFPLREFRRLSAVPLKAFLSDLEIKEVRDLGHTTNRFSRKIVADFISARLNGPR